MNLNTATRLNAAYDTNVPNGILTPFILEDTLFLDQCVLLFWLFDWYFKAQSRSKIIGDAHGVAVRKGKRAAVSEG